MSAFQQGLPTLGPALRDTYGLSIAGLGALLSATSLGTALAVLGWGRMSDRWDERHVSAVGLLGMSASLFMAAFVSTAGLAIAIFMVAGLFAAAPTVAIVKGLAREVPVQRLGLALGIRQSAVPLGGVVAGVLLPALVLDYGLGGALASLAACLAVAALAVEVKIARIPRALVDTSRVVGRTPAPTWTSIAPVICASMLYVFTQTGLLALLVVYLHDELGWALTHAAAAYAGMMAAAVVVRIAVGSLSDALGQRRWALFVGIGGSTVALLTGCAFTAGRPAVAPLLLAATLLSMSWNSLAFTMCAERVPLHRLGSVQGVLNCALFTAGGLSPAVLAQVAVGISWPAAWGLAALTTSGGVVVLLRYERPRAAQDGMSAGQPRPDPALMYTENGRMARNCRFNARSWRLRRVDCVRE